MAEKKTIEKWEEEYNLTILDPDGFDRDNPNLYEKKMTRQEFEAGLFQSTIEFNQDHMMK